MFTTLLIVLVLVFIGYALFTQYTKTDPTQSVAQRTWASLVAAVFAVAALVMSLFQGPVAP